MIQFTDCVTGFSTHVVRSKLDLVVQNEVFGCPESRVQGPESMVLSQGSRVQTESVDS